MRGQKYSKWKRDGAHRNEASFLRKKVQYPQWYCRPSSKLMRKKMRNIDIADGGAYRKIGGWFEWN